MTAATKPECALSELPNGTLVMNARNYIGKDKRTGGRAILYSHDGGETFAFSHIARDLPDSICQGDMASDVRGRRHAGPSGALLFSNPTSRVRRQNLSVHVSLDGALSWEPILQIFAGPSAYSSLTQLPDGSWACEYTSGVPAAPGSRYDVMNASRLALFDVSYEQSSGTGPKRARARARGPVRTVPVA